MKRKDDRIYCAAYIGHMLEFYGIPQLTAADLSIGLTKEFFKKVWNGKQKDYIDQLDTFLDGKSAKFTKIGLLYTHPKNSTRETIEKYQALKAWQVGMTGFTNPKNEDENDQSKNIWVVFPSSLENELKKELDSVKNVIEISPMALSHFGNDLFEGGIDYFLPDDKEKFSKHIRNTECKYE